MNANVKAYMDKLGSLELVETDTWTVTETLSAIYVAGALDSCADELFRILERHPLEDNHATDEISGMLELVPGYENKLLESLNREVSFAAVRMLKSLINSGQTHIGDIDMNHLLASITNNPMVNSAIRRTAGY